MSQSQSPNQKKPRLSLSELRSRLEKALKKNNDQAIKNLIEYLLSNYVNAEDLQNAIKTNLNILKLCLNEHELANPLVFPIFKALLMMYWKEFEEYITDVPKVWSLLAKDEECRKILSTKEGIEYLNRACDEAYNSLYNIVWILR